MELADIINSVILEYRESGVFQEWLNVYTSPLINEAFNMMCRENADEKELRTYGKKFYAAGVVPGALLLIIEKIDAHLPAAYMEVFAKNKHVLAQAYLFEKMSSDRQHLIHLINDSVALSHIPYNNATVIAHLLWFKQWIDARLNKDDDPIYDPAGCEVGKWIRDSLPHYISNPERRHGFVHDHKILHTIAQDAKFFFEKGEYLYALQLFLDLRSYTLRLREQFNFLFLRERFELLKRDPLTGLSNRFNLMDDLKKYPHEQFVILNIHDFSKMNMLYGKSYGDEVLITVANVLRRHIDDDHIYRFYADEFAFIVNPKVHANLIILLKKIETDIGRNTQMLTSVTFYGAYGTIDDTILDRCEYVIMSFPHEKHQRIVNADTVSADAIGHFTENLTISQKLRIALDNNKIVPYYQPVVSGENGKTIRYDALMRAVEEEGSVLEPGTFMRVLENMYIYPECIKTMCKKVFETFDKRPEEFSIHFSMSDVDDDDTRLFLFALFKQYPDTAKRCTIELFENEASVDKKQVNHFFTLLKQHDVKCALDHFGAGFSNLERLFRLPLDYIKIDRSILQTLDDPKTMKLAQTIVETAHTLHIQTVAESVSDAIMYEACRKLGIDLLSGGFVGSPVPLEAF